LGRKPSARYISAPASWSSIDCPDSQVKTHSEERSSTIFNGDWEKLEDSWRPLSLGSPDETDGGGHVVAELSVSVHSLLLINGPALSDDTI
jgi:hypothetical protein